MWFGSVVLPKTLPDHWLSEGLAGWIERRIAVQLLGINELHFRRSQEHKLLSVADDGSLPPLCPKKGISDLRGLEVSLRCISLSF